MTLGVEYPGGSGGENAGDAGGWLLLRKKSVPRGEREVHLSPRGGAAVRKPGEPRGRHAGEESETPMTAPGCSWVSPCLGVRLGLSSRRGLRAHSQLRGAFAQTPTPVHTSRTSVLARVRTRHTMCRCWLDGRPRRHNRVTLSLTLSLTLCRSHATTHEQRQRN